jgi:hypothetical protein
MRVGGRLRGAGGGQVSDTREMVACRGRRSEEALLGALRARRFRPGMSARIGPTIKTSHKPCSISCSHSLIL